MRYLLVPLLFFPFWSAHATGFNQKNTLTNTRYVETEADKARQTFTEAEEALPAFPTPQTSWQAIYISPSFAQQVFIAQDTIYLAPDQTIRYVLNTRSKQGIDNLTVEALYCANTSFQQVKPSSYKIYAYGDPINQRWLTARRAEWKDIGAILNSADPIRGTLFKIWCADGLPKNNADLLKRIQEAGGFIPKSGKQRSQ